jgi:hypothetical protein
VSLQCCLVALGAFVGEGERGGGAIFGPSSRGACATHVWWPSLLDSRVVVEHTHTLTHLLVCRGLWRLRLSRLKKNLASLRAGEEVNPVANFGPNFVKLVHEIQVCVLVPYSMVSYHRPGLV